ncbi:hypothetical protein T548_0103 [Lactococcus phage phiL47]|uniref:Uncharacterized protein n=1 Tax=Lactococcus phage phiL47 TaxID=1412875 RepID=V9VD85_9CAUD|nr:hypothetical protein T548_0103 [Lactococcus phage phiL47]AHC94181.1 hypothetical protein T548_0103 [Lactococcus phage phiL47]
MKKRIKQEVVFSSKEVKEITGFELKNTWGDFYFEQDGGEPIWEVLDATDKEEFNKAFGMCMDEIKRILKDYVSKNFVGDFYLIVQEGSIHYRASNYTSQFHSNNNSEIFFYYEDTDTIEV